MSKGTSIFKGGPGAKSLDERILEGCCSFHIGLDGVNNSSNSKPIKFIMSRRGVMKIVQNKIGLFVVETKDVPGLPAVGEGLVLGIPKIPYYMLLQTITFFRAVMEKYNNSEAMVQFYYDEQTSSYIMYCPEQEVSGAKVTFKRNAVMDDTYTLVMDIHSHNTMSAHFSSIDDADEKETRIFGVIGKLKNDTPEMSFRISVGGDFKEIGTFDIFESPFPETSFPEDWLDRCKRPVYTSYSSYRNGSRTVFLPAASGHTDKWSSAEYYDDSFYDNDSFYYPSAYDSAYTSKVNSEHTSVKDLDVSTMRQRDLIDLVKDIITVDIESVALAIMDERVEDDIISYVHSATVREILDEERGGK